MDIRYYFFVLFVTPVASFVKLQSESIYLTTGEWFIAVRSPVSSLCPISSHHIPVLPCAVSCISWYEDIPGMSSLLSYQACISLYCNITLES